jgi:hypothetical protein
MRNAFLFIVLLCLSIASLRCPQQGQNEAIIGVVRANLSAMEREDITGVKRTIDSSSPVFDMTVDMTEEIFQQYDLTYTLERIDVIEVKDNNARVSFIQVTEKTSGPAFRDNRLSGIHTLKKTKGTWVITNTEIVDIEYLDE